MGPADSSPHLFALSKVNEIINTSSDKLNDYYPRYQRELIESAARQAAGVRAGQSHGRRTGFGKVWPADRTSTSSTSRTTQSG